MVQNTRFIIFNNMDIYVLMEFRGIKTAADPGSEGDH